MARRRVAAGQSEEHTDVTMYAALYMASTRTQIYLTQEQRDRIEALRRRDGRSLAEVVRAALDSYLDGVQPPADDALDATFGAAPGLIAASRDDRDRG